MERHVKTNATVPMARPAILSMESVCARKATRVDDAMKSVPMRNMGRSVVRRVNAKIMEHVIILPDFAIVHPALTDHCKLIIHSYVVVVA